MDINRARYWFITTALSDLGRPYIWGGDDPSGYDCSGLVVECLKTVGLLGEFEDLTAAGLAARFSEHRLERPKTAALVFWRCPEGSVFHVGICLDDFFCIAASGGDSQTTNPARAWRKNAFVRIRPLRFDPERNTILDPLGSSPNLDSQ